jgi:acetyl esterase/lipase
MSLSLDPQVAAARDRFFGEPGKEFAPLPAGDIESRRALFESVHAMTDVAQPMPDDVVIKDFYTTAEDGAQILLRWYTKAGPQPGSAALYFHGSGLILSRVELYDGMVSRHVSASGVPFLSVEYRKAPEFPFPTPVEDAYAALTWLTEHAAELGVDPARIAVAGHSGGATIAASLALLARDRGGPAIAQQILMYPALDDRTTTPDPQLAGLINWSYEDSVTAWRAYLGAAAGGPDVPAYAAVARATDLAGLPPLFMEANELDILRDEDIDYARRSYAAGVSTELHVYRGVPHAFEVVAFDTDVARRGMAERVRILRSL